MLIAYAAAKRGPPVGRIRTAAILQRRSPRRSNSLASRDALPLSCPSFRAQTTAEAARSFALHLRPSPNAPTLAARARTPFARDRKACPPRGVAGLHPVVVGHPARFVSRCARPGRPRCAPSALAPPALHLPLRPRGGPGDLSDLQQTHPNPQQIQLEPQETTAVGWRALNCSPVT